MTRVLLIADTERVQRIFLSLQEREVLQLQTASTLESGESEMAASRYDFVFVQSRISGFSGIILLRHLDKILPEKAQLVLLAGDAEDCAQARKHGRESLDLSLGDDLLEQGVLAVIAGAPLPVPPPVATSRAAEPAPAETPDAPPAPPEEVQKRELPEPEAGTEPAPREERRVRDAASQFEEAIARASAQVAPMSVTEVEDRVELGKGSQPAAAGGQGVREEAPPAAGRPQPVETLAEALRRAEKKKSRRPYLWVLSALALFAVPLVYYLAGTENAPDGARQASPELSAPPPRQAAPEAGVPAVPPAVQQPAAPAAPKRGVAALPPILEGTRFDAGYGKAHPGWVRYEGLRAEYKLFREDDLYQAIQVVAKGGGTVSDEIFRRMLREFGGVDGYRVESTSSKGDYLVEQCSTNGDVALTIYRNGKNLKMKGFVIYYQP